MTLPFWQPCNHFLWHLQYPHPNLTHRSPYVLVSASSPFLFVTVPTHHSPLPIHHAPDIQASRRSVKGPNASLPQGLCTYHSPHLDHLPNSGWLAPIIGIFPQMSLIQRGLLSMATLGCAYLHNMRILCGWDYVCLFHPLHSQHRAQGTSQELNEYLWSKWGNRNSVLWWDSGALSKVWCPYIVKIWGLATTLWP